MSYTEDEFISISLLSQYYYCPRRAGLLLLEEQWQDNIHTVEGAIIHENVHSGGHESRSDYVITHSLYIRSFELGIAGIADCVEFYASSSGCGNVPWLPGIWTICPVEFKHGQKRNEMEYEVQVCAQALCLEEMIGCHIDHGFIYYGDDRRRNKVSFNSELRELVISGAAELHKMLQCRNTPLAVKSPKCRECSMRDVCLPGKLKRTNSYLDQLWKQACGED
ncbi:MAG: CRISPR-associated exonuclease Cas4 [Clostridiales bacterium]|jgi:CRISPR-associated exonuclease Cas4|nr:CRISPR-associated exonuclease Cas4 [Clostridiales bacterium]